MASLSSITGVGLVATITGPGTITLPLVSDTPNRQLIFKDGYGNLSNYPLTFQTQGLDLFEDGKPTLTINNSFGFTTLYGYDGRWYTLGGTNQLQGTISSLTVSSINGTTLDITNTNLISTTGGLQYEFQTAGFLSSPNLISTTGGLQYEFNTAGFLSSPNLISTTGGLQREFNSAGFLSSLNLVSTVQGLGSIGYISSGSFASSLVSTANVISQFFSSFSTSYATRFITSSLTASSITAVNVAPSQTNLWVAVGTDATQNIKYSVDGFNWTNANGAQAFTGGSGVGVAWNGQIWVAVGNVTSGQNVKYSFNGRDWLDAAGAKVFSSLGWSVAWNGRLWVAVGSDTTQAIKYSSDGINWTNAAGAQIFNQNVGTAVAWNGSMWVAVGWDTVQNIKYSYDGINWSNAAGTKVFSADAAYGIGWNGRMWVAGGEDSVQTLKYSYDGINWSNVAGAKVFATRGRWATWNGEIWVAVGDDTTQAIKYSYDGINWSNAAGAKVFNSDVARYAAWNGQFWLAIGSDTAQTIKYSYDGINWSNLPGTQVFSGNTASFLAFSSNVIPAYQQQYLQILPQGIPLYLASTNTILATPSSLILNYTMTIDNVTDKVGINTGNPQTDLDVNGIGRFLTMSSFQTQASSIMVGLSNSAFPLDVNGTGRFITVSSIQAQVSSVTGQAATISSIAVNSLVIGSGTGWVNFGPIQTVAISSTQANTNILYGNIVSSFQTQASSIMIATSNSAYTFDVNGSARISSLILAHGTTAFSTLGPAASNIRLGLTTGDAYKPTGASWSITSDMRIKENIVDADLNWCYNDVKNIPLRRFQYSPSFINQAKVADKRVLGFIAQEISTIVPKAITIGQGFGFDDLQMINIDQLQMSHFGAFKKMIIDKEALESTSRGQRFELETLHGKMTSILSTLEGLQGR